MVRCLHKALCLNHKLVEPLLPGLLLLATAGNVVRESEQWLPCSVKLHYLYHITGLNPIQGSSSVFVFSTLICKHVHVDVYMYIHRRRQLINFSECVISILYYTVLLSVWYMRLFTFPEGDNGKLCPAVHCSLLKTSSGKATCII